MVKIWLGLGMKSMQLGSGKDHVLQAKMVEVDLEQLSLAGLPSHQSISPRPAPPPLDKEIRSLHEI